MTKDDILSKMQDILSAEFQLDRETITPDAKLFDDLQLDSIDAVDLLVKMKEFMPGKVNPEMFKKVVTVQDVVDVIAGMTSDGA
ncbi:MAG: acyl carrier protein [Treponema sp.]|nr:acyl carrier protein [Treponema sp.]